MHRPSIAMMLLLIGMTGCGEPSRVEVPATHPANPDAAAAPIPPRSTVLTPTAGAAGSTGTTEPASPASAAHGHHHGHDGSAGASGAGHESASAAGDAHAMDPAQAGDRYTCPMHPDITESHPGKCPTCGMALKKKEVAADQPGNPDQPSAAHDTDHATAAPAPTEAKPAPTPDAGDRYTCSMHPEIIQSEPGKCPKCGMKLKKIDGAHP